MKMNLLALTQDILNDMDGDEVNSINDTTESEQVANIVKSTYLAMMSDRNWPHTRRIVQLVASGNISLPNYMKVPDNVKEMIFINYNVANLAQGTKKVYKEMKYINPDDFLRMSNGRNSSASNIDMIIDPSSATQILIRNDIAPSKYTSFDDENLVFDSYDKLVNQTLQQSRSQAYGYTFPTWVHTDTAIPDLPNEAFMSLLEEAKSKASMKLRQVRDSKAEQESVRQRHWLSRKDWRVKGGVGYPNYGRHTRNKYFDPTFDRSN